MKKTNFINLIIIGFIFAIPTVFAKAQDPCKKDTACCSEIKPGPFAFSYPKDLGLECPKNLYIYGKFIWIKPSEEGLEYAVDQDNTNNAAPNERPLINGKVLGFSRGSDKWDWKPGFRVGFGYEQVSNNFGVLAEWTYIKIKSNSAVDNNGTGFLLPLFYPPLGDIRDDHINLTNASARWSGDYSTLDLMFSKSYHVSRYFIATPSFGIKTAWIDQDLLTRYYQNNNSKRVVLVKNDFTGVGIRGAYDNKFLLGSNISIFSKTALSLLFGKFDLSQDSDNPSLATDPPNNLIYEYDIKNSFYRVRPCLEIALGLNWSSFINDNKQLVSLNAGYEFICWFEQNQLRRFFDSDPTSNKRVARADLSFNGFVFGLNVDF